MERRQFSEPCSKEKVVYENCIQLKFFEHHCATDKYVFSKCIQEHTRPTNKIEGKSLEVQVSTRSHAIGHSLG